MSKIFIEVEIFEANGYRHDLELLIILHYLHVSYLTRSGCLFFCEPENWLPFEQEKNDFCKHDGVGPEL